MKNSEFRSQKTEFRSQKTVFRILNAVFCILFLCAGCRAIDIITGVGAGASVAGFVAPAFIQARGQVKPKEILVKIDLAYQEYNAQVENIMHNVGLTPKERKALIKEKTRVLNSRVKAYKGLLGNAYGLPRELVDYLSGPEGQEFIGVIAKALPPPWNELLPTVVSLGLAGVSFFGLRGRNRFRNMALLLGNTMKGLERLGLDENKIREALEMETSRHKITVADVHGFFERHNIGKSLKI